MKLLWNIWGWIFVRWWIRFLHRATYWRWFSAARRWCFRNTRWAWRFFRPGVCSCPHCFYSDWTEHEELFVCIESGAGFNGEYTCHWFRGIQTCARCGQANEYGDSD